MWFSEHCMNWFQIEVSYITTIYKTHFFLAGIGHIGTKKEKLFVFFSSQDRHGGETD